VRLNRRPPGPRQRSCAEVGHTWLSSARVSGIPLACKGGIDLTRRPPVGRRYMSAKLHGERARRPNCWKHERNPTIPAHPDALASSSCNKDEPSNWGAHKTDAKANRPARQTGQRASRRAATARGSDKNGAWRCAGEAKGGVGSGRQRTKSAPRPVEGSGPSAGIAGVAAPYLSEPVGIGQLRIARGAMIRSA